MNFTIDAEIAAGYRQRGESVAATRRQLEDKIREARGDRDHFTMTARSRRAGHNPPLVDDESLGALAWLSDAERGRLAKIEAELSQLTRDHQVAETGGAYALGTGQRVAAHLAEAERADEARIRAENMMKPANPPVHAPGPSTRM